MTIGTTVRPSDHALEPIRQRSLGGYSQKMRDASRREYETQRERRGVITDVITAPSGTITSSYVTGTRYRVRWFDGSSSETLDYMIATA